VSVTVLREITKQVDPPRALFVDHPLGHTLGQPGDAETQRAVIERALAMLEGEADMLEEHP
jgi:D-proline reductase (dithiol) PrdB